MDEDETGDNHSYSISYSFNEDKQKRERWWSIVPPIRFSDAVGIRKCVTLTVFFLCTILSSFFAMRSTSWSFAMFTGLGLFDGARWPCLHLCGENEPVSVCVCVCVSFSGSMRGIHCLSLRSRLLCSDVRFASVLFFWVESFSKNQMNLFIKSMWTIRLRFRLNRVVLEYRKPRTASFFLVCLIRKWAKMWRSVSWIN